MKIGDIVRRKDMPNIQARIIGENKKWPAWDAEITVKLRGIKINKGLIFKDDDRWEVIILGGS